MGRQKLPAALRVVPLRIGVDPSVWARLEALAKRRGVKVYRVAREALERGLETLERALEDSGNPPLEGGDPGGWTGAESDAGLS
jgi:hypothetical protein